MGSDLRVTKAPMVVVRCDCSHDYQDKRYGPQRRAANPTMKGARDGKVSVYRCTVCGKEHSL